MKKFYTNHKFFFPGLLLIGLCLFLSCNKDNVIEEDITQKTVISLDSETGINTLKIGHTLTISPTVEHSEGAMYSSSE